MKEKRRAHSSTPFRHPCGERTRCPLRDSNPAVLVTSRPEQLRVRRGRGYISKDTDTYLREIIFFVFIASGDGSKYQETTEYAVCDSKRFFRGRSALHRWHLLYRGRSTATRLNYSAWCWPRPQSRRLCLLYAINGRDTPGGYHIL